MAMVPIEMATGLSMDVLLALPPDRVFENLGEAVVPLGASRLDPSDYYRIGRGWLYDQRARICEVCRQNEIICDYMNGGNTYKRSQIAGILFDLIGLIFKFPAAGAAWASIALIQLGLDQFCRDSCAPPRPSPISAP